MTNVDDETRAADAAECWCCGVPAPCRCERAGKCTECGWCAEHCRCFRERTT